MNISLLTLVSRISDELEHSVREVEHIEATVLELSAERGLTSGINELQKLDLLRQHLGELARFMKAVQLNMDAGMAVDVKVAINDVLLTGLRRRLEGTAHGETQVAGDFELL